MDFDFDLWAKLAQDAPQEFERRRREAVQSVIDSAPMHLRVRLHGLQCRLDLERSRSSTPLGSCVRLNSLMWAGFHRLRRELNSAARPADTNVSSGATRPSARIIAFAPKRKNEPGAE